MDNISEDQERLLSEEQHKDEEKQSFNKRSKGGFVTIPFILANEVFENAASSGMTPNMIVYLMNDYKMSVTKAQNLIYLWNTANSFTPFIGALLADSLLGRFLTIGIGSIFSLLGMLVLWLTTVIPQVKPPACNPLEQNCQTPTTGQYAFLIFSFILMSIGSGGIASCSQIFGADQVDQADSPRQKISLEIFFGWYYTFGCLSVIIALTVVVYIQDNLGWMIGFGVPLISMFFATIAFFLAAPFYVIIKGNKDLLMSLAQVLVAAYKNRKMDLSSFQYLEVQYYQGKDPAFSIPTDRLRFLNKACIIRDIVEDIGPDGLPTQPWRLCRVEDVEGLKSFIRLLPIWITGIMLYINSSTSSISLLLTRTMDRHLGSKFIIPAASFRIVETIVIVIWLPLYDRVILPIASKIHGKPVRLSVKLRMLIGLFCSFLWMLSSGIVETIRRAKAISEGLEDDLSAVIPMSATWAIVPSIFSGLAAAFFSVAQIELFFTELPRNMITIAVSIFGLGATFGSLMATSILNLTDYITKSEGKDGWIASNVNKGHYDYYFYLLSTFNFINILYYLYCSRAYGSVGERSKMVVHAEDVDEQRTAPTM